MSIQNVSVAVVCNFCKHLVQPQTVSPKLWTVLLNDVTFYVISRHWFINRFVFASDFDSFKTLEMHPLAAASRSRLTVRNVLLYMRSHGSALNLSLRQT